ncbi:unnamed protein product [Cunninghamella blakesleeana]
MTVIGFKRTIESDDTYIETENSLIAEGKMEVEGEECNKDALTQKELPSLPSTTANKRQRILHPCPYPGCEKIYNKKPKLTNYIRIHTGEKPFTCPYPGCNKAYRRKAQLTVHCRLHDPETSRIFKCTDCDQRFTAKHHLKRHQESIHLAPLPYQCQWENCGVAFHKKYELRKHQCIHTNEKPYLCDHPNCNSSFSFKSRLNYHKDTVHSGILRYLCTEPDCNQRFAKWTELRTHVNTCHTVRCSECNKEFAKRSQLTHHIKYVHLPKEPSICKWPGCVKSFSSKRALKLHMDTVHEPIPRFHCTFENCVKSFVFRSYLAKHEESHKKKQLKKEKKRENNSSLSLPTTKTTITLMEELTGFSLNPKKDRKYKCPINDCEHSFLREYDLKRHLESNLHRNDIHYIQQQTILLPQDINNQS